MITRKGESGILQRCTREQHASRRRQRVEAEVRLGLTVLEPVRLHIGLQPSHIWLQPELHMVAAWVYIGLQAVLEPVCASSHTSSAKGGAALSSAACCCAAS